MSQSGVYMLKIDKTCTKNSTIHKVCVCKIF